MLASHPVAGIPIAYLLACRAVFLVARIVGRQQHAAVHTVLLVTLHLPDLEAGGLTGPALAIDFVAVVLQMQPLASRTEFLVGSMARFQRRAAVDAMLPAHAPRSIPLVGIALPVLLDRTPEPAPPLLAVNLSNGLGSAGRAILLIA